MSFDLNISSKTRPFDPDAWSKSLNDQLKEFKFDPSIDWNNHEGYTPCTWKDSNGELIQTGFEFFKDDQSKTTRNLLGIKTTKHNWSVTLSLKSDDDELKAGWLAAGVLANICSGTLTDPQSGNTFDGDAALKEAQKQMQPKTPPQNKYNTFDFKAHSTFQKQNEKEIHKLAKTKLAPLEMKRKGRGKSWMLDKGWYTILVEFLPSRHHYQVMVNVAATIHWDINETWSFDVMLDAPTPRFESAEELGANNEYLFDLIIPKIEELVRIMSDFSLLREHEMNSIRSYEPHKSRKLGIYSALLGDTEARNQYFQNVIDYSPEVEHDWFKDLKESTRALKEETDNIETFRARLIENIKASRALKKLPEMDIELP
jgi:hypothetical protein